MDAILTAPPLHNSIANNHGNKWNESSKIHFHETSRAQNTLGNGFIEFFANEDTRKIIIGDARKRRIPQQLSETSPEFTTSVKTYPGWEPTYDKESRKKILEEPIPPELYRKERRHFDAVLNSSQLPSKKQQSGILYLQSKKRNFELDLNGTLQDITQQPISSTENTILFTRKSKVEDARNGFKATVYKAEKPYGHPECDADFFKTNTAKIMKKLRNTDISAFDPIMTDYDKTYVKQMKEKEKKSELEKEIAEVKSLQFPKSNKKK